MLQGQLGPHFEPLVSWRAGTRTLASADITHATQSWWADQVCKVSVNRLASSGTLRDQLRRSCQHGVLASAWLDATPSPHLHTSLADEEFSLLVKFWLGLPILPEKQVLPGCPECGGATDPFGDHFVSCCKNGFAQRHHAVRDAFHDICVRTRIMVQKEVQASDDDRRRPQQIFCCWGGTRVKM